MVDTMVLEAIVERRGSSSLPWGTKNSWGCSSPGRASDLHSEGSGFESCHLHQEHSVYTLPLLKVGGAITTETAWHIRTWPHDPLYMGTETIVGTER